MEDAMTQQEGERLARFLARAGVASRRHAEELIAAGRVQVNGATITSQGTRINPQRDTVTVDGKAVQTPTRHVYIMLHKPTATSPQPLIRRAARPYWICSLSNCA